MTNEEFWGRQRIISQAGKSFDPAVDYVAVLEDFHKSVKEKDDKRMWDIMLKHGRVFDLIIKASKSKERRGMPMRYKNQA